MESVSCWAASTPVTPTPVTAEYNDDRFGEEYNDDDESANNGSTNNGSTNFRSPDDSPRRIETIMPDPRKRLEDGDFAMDIEDRGMLREVLEEELKSKEKTSEMRIKIYERLR